MASLRDPFKSPRTYKRRVTFIELALTLSVIIGLVFVTIRVKHMDFAAAGLPQTEQNTAPRADGTTTTEDTEVVAPTVKAELEPDATRPAETKSP